MRKLNYATTKSMVEDILNNYKNVYWDVICHYEYASELIEEFVRAGKLIYDIKICAPEIDGYDEEYIVSILDDEIYCEPLKRNDKYIRVESEVVFVHGECNAAVLNNIDSNVVYEYYIDEYDDEEENVHGVLNYSKGDDGKIHGFTYSDSDDDNYFSYSYYTKDELSKSDVASMLKNINV